MVMCKMKKEVINKISLIMRSARKFKGITQQDLAKALGCSQSALSKMENGVLIPSAPQWFSFCCVTEIPAYSLVHGFIDRQINAELKSGKIINGHSLPARYLNDRGIKVKHANPFLAFIKEKFGVKEYGSFLKKCKLTQDFFIDYDNQISFNFLYDVFKYLKEKNSIDSESIKAMAAFNLQKETHGLTFEVLSKAKTSIDLLVLYASNYRNYQVDFLVSSKNRTENSVSLILKPKLHLRRFKIFKDQEFLGFIREYTLHTLAALAKLSKNPGILKINIASSYANGDDFTQLDISLS